MPRIDIQCPACGGNSEIALEQHADVVAFSCPSCRAALVHYHGQTFRIDESELRYLRSRGHVREARAWVREGEAQTESDTRRPDTPREAIDESDIAQLRRDLDSCGSVDEFLRLLG